MFLRVDLCTCLMSDVIKIFYLNAGKNNALIVIFNSSRILKTHFVSISLLKPKLRCDYIVNSLQEIPTKIISSKF